MNALAQSNNVRKFGISLDLGMAVGLMSARYASTFAGSINYQLPVSTNLAVTATAGYAIFIGNDYDYYTGEQTPYSIYNAFPVKAGLKYYFNRRLYAEAQAGVAFGTNDGASPAFAYAPAWVLTLLAASVLVCVMRPGFLKDVMPTGTKILIR